MRELGVLISNILENDLSKFYKILGLILFTQEKTLKDSKRRIPFTWANFFSLMECLQQLFVRLEEVVL